MNSPNFSNGNLKLEQFLVSGLGYFGQHCVVALKEFAVNFLASSGDLSRFFKTSAIPSAFSQGSPNKSTVKDDKVPIVNAYWLNYYAIWWHV
ncbi:hypothetical protein [Microcystis aeruginosa]|uniref:hypothetical protein n=1 Tax=Microcystis aeruginosa TaxID=1126 RepID=UPI0012BA5723|nr:hypothetical protein [Microcystis aeruginosa]